MEFNKKLQELRKEKGLTQEELAQALFVSRTAVSKWESGRGYPNIDSLKAIAGFFSVTVDELLSSNEVLTIAEEDSKKKENNIRSLIFGLIDVSIALFFFLPLFGQNVNGTVKEVSLISLTNTTLYVKVIYFIIVSLIVIFGIVTLTLQNCRKPFWVKSSSVISLILSATATLLFIISTQAYAAGVLFIFTAIKAIILLKKQ